MGHLSISIGLKSQAAFELMIYRSLINSPSHCATPLGINFKKETIYKIDFIGGFL